MKEENKGDVFKSSVWYFFSNVLLQAIGFLTVPIFSRILTHNEFGQYNNYTAWLQIMAIVVTLNLKAALISGKYDYKEKYDEFILSTFSLSTLITITFWIIINLNQTFFSNLMNLDIYYINWMFLYIIFYSAFTLFQMREKFLFEYKSSVSLSLQNALFTGIWSVVLVLFLQDKLKGRIIGSILPTVLIGLYIIINFLKRGKRIDFKSWKYALKVSLPYIPHSLSLVALASIDKIMITKMFGTEDTALYSMAYTCGLVITILITALNDAYTPWLGDRLDENDYGEINRLSKKYIFAFLLLSAGVMLTIPEILLIMGGKSYLSSQFIIAPILLGSIYQFLYLMFVNIEQFKKKTIGMAICSVVSAIVNFILNFIFIPIYGYVAAAYTTAIGYALLLAMHMIIVKKIGYGRAYDYKYIIVSAICALLYTILASFLYTNNSARLIAIIIYLGVFEFVLVKNNDTITKKFKELTSQSKTKKIIIIGAGGFAKSILDSMDYSKYEIAGFIDDYSKEKEHEGIEILGNKLEDIKDKEEYGYYIAIGNNEQRRKWYNELVKYNLDIISIIDKSAIVSKTATIGKGCFLGKYSVVNSEARIGDNTIVNTRAIVEHGCIIGESCNISTNTVVNGDVIAGDESFIGSSAVVLGQLKIGKRAIIGAGAVVIDNIEDDIVAVGIPAKEKKKRSK